MTGATHVTVYFFTWHDDSLGRAVQAPRPATFSAILAAGGKPIHHSGHQILASEINELGFKRRPVRACEVCGESLLYVGTRFDGCGPQPRRDQVFKCPGGHEVWAFVDRPHEWRRRWPSESLGDTAAAT